MSYLKILCAAEVSFRSRESSRQCVAVWRAIEHQGHPDWWYYTRIVCVRSSHLLSGITSGTHTRVHTSLDACYGGWAASQTLEKAP